MKAVALLCNAVLLLFTLFVLATDGLPTKPAYVALTLALILVPVFTAFVLVRDGARGGPPAVGAVLNRGAGVANLVLVAIVCWAIVDQYPHPKEEGVVAYAVLTVLTPLLSAALLLRHRAGRREPRFG